MDILITQWALDSYLELKSNQVFSLEEYRTIIRPDVMNLLTFPHHPKFNQDKFWSVAQYNKQIITNGYKMKWHKIGNGRVQLRLAIGIFNNKSFLCEAYVKHNQKEEQRKLAKFKVFLELIRRNTYTIRGRLI